MNRTTAAVCATLLVAASLPLSGCIYGRSSTSISGNFVGQGTYNKIEVGSTDEAWVKTALGSPNRQTQLADGGSLWTYSYSRSEESRGTFLWLIGGSSRERTEGSTHIEFDELGVVRDTWRD
ncbi:MAG: hypothetical protein AAGF47_01205 [Planctomycetota bacterium]